MRVLKWTVPVDDQPHPIGSGRVLHVGCQDDPTGHRTAHAEVQVWTLESSVGITLPERMVQVYGTGQPLPDGVGAGYHIGTVLVLGGALVWHVFAVRNPE